MPARFGPFGPTLEQIKKAKDNSALKDLTKLTELDANLKSPVKVSGVKDEFEKWSIMHDVHPAVILLHLSLPLTSQRQDFELRGQEHRTRFCPRSWA